MTMRSHRQRRRESRGAILLEVMLAVALFVAAAGFSIAATRSVFSAMARSCFDATSGTKRAMAPASYRRRASSASSPKAMRGHSSSATAQ